MNKEFSTYRWLSFELKKRDKMPVGPHFQVLLFTQRNEYSPPYDRHDSGTSYAVDEVRVFVFTKKSDLEMFVDDAARFGANFVFYHVNSLGKATVKVDVETEVE